jgi:hypothetical protein
MRVRRRTGASVSESDLSRGKRAQAGQGAVLGFFLPLATRRSHSPTPYLIVSQVLTAGTIFNRFYLTTEAYI